jgi:hypothetical protein|tara:strand:- start:2124 stop:2807 length:684 start_codon:yes stop_codon:yes gene_type:complete
VLKVELHTHTAGDPQDAIPYGPVELIDRASALGYDAVALTLHDRQLDLREFAAHAASRRITLIPGVERTVDGCHVLLLNFPPSAARVVSFDEIAELKACSSGLVIAPHLFFPLTHCLRGLMDRHAALIDAVEVSYFHTPLIDFNRAARRWAQAHDKPLVGSSDVHRLWQLGHTCSLVDSASTPDAICAAIRAGHVEVRSRPVSLVRIAALLAAIKAHNFVAGLRPSA